MIDFETVAIIKSTQAITTFTNYIKSKDESLTLPEAIAVAAVIVNNLPDLFEENPQLVDYAIAIAKEIKTARNN